MAEPTDEILLARHLGGDPAALAALAVRHERSMLGLACGLLGGRRDLAMDAVQEVWVRVIRFAGGFEGRSSVKTWIYTILTNQCRTMRAARGSSPLPESLPEAAGPGRPGDERLHAALEALGDGPREVVLMCYHAGLTHEVVAEVLGVPLGTVKSRLHGALTSLRAALSAEVAS
jgi:RNA polymerase sigma-70 factor (ECF subfamily)